MSDSLLTINRSCSVRTDILKLQCINMGIILGCIWAGRLISLSSFFLIYFLMLSKPGTDLNHKIHQYSVLVAESLFVIRHSWVQLS